MYLKKLKIGNVELNNNLILAPMAGITDLPFRIITEKFQPGLVCTEMVSAKALFYGDDKTKQLLKSDGEIVPISMQIFGSDPETMGFAAKYVSQFADIVDINMGCPSPKVVKNGDGSKLLLNLEKAQEIIKSVVKFSTKPVTVKFRKGWNDEKIVACELARIAEECGVSAITIHGRTREQYYTGKADLDIIKKVKESVKIPVIGNGDIIDEESAIKMFEYTGVDGIMIGRGTIGNPWIFEQIKYFLENNQKISRPTKEEKFQLIKQHIELAIKEKGEKIGINEMRKNISAYTKNMADSSNFRNEINHITNYEELINRIEEFFSY
ncbi:MAG: tRNA dihydrouridine synthase DusB [Clostridium sp. 26_21]|nr:MAG: tRNA dihydrouridine synthase DusB [Clostridium sp. 26_21]